MTLTNVHIRQSNTSQSRKQRGRRTRKGKKAPKASKSDQSPRQQKRKGTQKTNPWLNRNSFGLFCGVLPNFCLFLIRPNLAKCVEERPKFCLIQPHFHHCLVGLFHQTRPLLVYFLTITHRQFKKHTSARACFINGIPNLSEQASKPHRFINGGSDPLPPHLAVAAQKDGKRTLPK